MGTGRAKDPSQLSGPSVREARRSYVEEQYPVLVLNDRLGAMDLRRLRREAAAFEYGPLISIVMPALGCSAGLVERALDSVLGQVYAGWELLACDAPAGGPASPVLSRYERLDDRVKVAYGEPEGDVAGMVRSALPATSGEFVCVLGGEDELAPDALLEVVRLLQEHPQADVVYTDEDRIEDGGVRSHPHFKPGWSPDLLLSGDYVSRLCVYRKSLVQAAGGYREGFDGYEGYDLILRVAERTGEIRHVPRVLYHRRDATGHEDVGAGGGGLAGARRALSEALRRRGVEGSVEDGLLPGHLRAKAKVAGRPKVSLIVPTRDNVSLLKNCIESVERETTYDNYEILIVDNDSADPETVRYLASTPHRVVPFREPFNYSRINNFAVSQARGDYVVLLNDDTEVIAGGWLEAMLEHAQRPEVGAVGAKLVYPDGRIQHAGVVVGVGGVWSPGVATHAHQFYPSTHPGHLGTVSRVTNYSAVTAACMMLRRSVFEEVGGFDEENLKVSFNDVDLCLRIRERGYSVVYTPHAELYHHESVSRGYKGDPAEVIYMRDHWGPTLDGEPFYNAHFSRGSGDFNLRADMLTPKILRQENGRPPEGPAGPSEDASTSVEEGPQGTVDARPRDVRGSHRTSLVPARGIKSIQVPPREEAGPGEATVVPGHARGVDAPQASTNRSPAEASGKLGVRPDQLVWMFGSPRTGSTWLSRMMAELEGQERWHEPYVGLLFGSFLYERLGNNTKLLNSPAFIMGEPYRRVWLDSIRSFVIKGAEARYPTLEADDYLVIKEPNGSVGAPLLLEATPESRLIFLIRDPRDVVASRLDAFRKDSWSAQDRDLTSAERLNTFTKQLAEDYSNVVSQVQRSYETHPGEKTLVRYEDLRRDTAGTLKIMYDGLKIPVDEGRLHAAAAKHAWEKVPEGSKGPGKFYRKAKPGGWEEDLSAEQIRIIEEATGAVISRYYR